MILWSKGKKMNKKLYKMMDWPEIETLIYAEEDKPHELLGGHYKKGGILIQAFFPGAKEVTVIIQLGRAIEEHKMELMDEEGFYAVFIKSEKNQSYNYRFKVVDKDGETGEFYDPYSFEPVVDEDNIRGFDTGENSEIYKILGPHVRTIDGIKGTSFAVWAPDALRASVVGDFNGWDARMHQMRRLENGIFELFIPGVYGNERYKYEFRFKGGVIRHKRDPYAVCDGTGCSLVYESRYEFKDEKWLDERKKKHKNGKPVSIYEMDLIKQLRSGEREGLSFEKAALSVCEDIEKSGYTHVELLPVMRRADMGKPYEVSDLYSPDPKLCTPDELRAFIDMMHGKGIGVILDWVASYFTNDEEGLKEFDSTCLYGHLDPRQKYNAKRGTLNYNYGRGQVSCYLMSNAVYWLEEYHADGLRVDSLDEMMYLDYSKAPGEWIPNAEGGKENLEAISFIRRLNKAVSEKKTGALMIAEGLSLWKNVTLKEKEGLYFDYKWDTSLISDILDYISFDPFFRSHHYGELLYGLSYFTEENFIIPLSGKTAYDENGTDRLLMKMPGGLENKAANLRAVLGYLAAYPSKFLCFIEPDPSGEENKEETLSEDDPEKTYDSSKFDLYFRELLKLYKKHPALFENDGKEGGFEWINNLSANEDIIVFLRKSRTEKLLIVLNFSNVLYGDYRIGVDAPGKYKEIFSSDAEKYGGKGNTNPRVKNSRKEDCDGRKDCIKVKVAPLAFSVFACPL